MLELSRRLQDEAMGTVRAAIIRFNPESVPKEKLLKAKQDLAAFAHSYLKRELGGMLEQAIPALGMYSLIATKIDHFRRGLENLIKHICKRELEALEWFGAGIGVIMGFTQIFVNVLVQ